MAFVRARSTSASSSSPTAGCATAPKLAPLITAVGVSFIFQDIGIWLERVRAEVSGRACCRRAACTSARSIRIEYDFIVVVVTIPLLLLMTYIVHEDQARQGDAGDRAGPGRAPG